VPILVELVNKVIAIGRPDQAEKAGTKHSDFLNFNAGASLPFTHQHTSSYTASLCILLRLIPHHNLVNRLPGHWCL
jgi:hypothetical protein